MRATDLVTLLLMPDTLIPLQTSGVRRKFPLVSHPLAFAVCAINRSHRTATSTKRDQHRTALAPHRHQRRTALAPNRD